jgi:hypothetical protein
MRRRCRLCLTQQVAAGRLPDDFAVARGDLAGLDGGHRPAAQFLAFERREVGHPLQVFRPYDPLQIEIDDGQVGIGADGYRALLRIDSVDLRRSARGAIHQQLQRDAAQSSVMQQCGQMRSQRRKARSRAVQPGFWPLGCARTRCVVGADGIDGALAHALPKRIVMVLGAHRRYHLHQETIGVVTGNSEIRRGRLHGEAQALAACIAHHLQALAAR